MTNASWPATRNLPWRSKFLPRLSYGLLTSFLFIFYSSNLTFFAYAELYNGMEAEIVVGQTDFNTNTAAVSESKFNNAETVATDGKRLFVADAGNRRILIFNSIPKRNGAKADVVLGQPDFTTNADQGLNARSIPGQTQVKVFSDGQRLFISDYDNNRLLIWNKIPESNYVSADIVLGRPDFTAAGNGTTAQDFSCPTYVFSDMKRLFLADGCNNRVLIWNKIPTTNYTPADLVLGQPNFTTSSAGTTRQKMSSPVGIYSDGTMLMVTEYGNNRVLIWNKIPSENYAPADIVLGQEDFQSSSRGLDANRMALPVAVCVIGQKMFVVEQANHRVLIWKKIPTANGTPADFVLGQPDLKSAVQGTSQNQFRGLTNDIATDGRRLFVADLNNNRILIFNLAGTQKAANLGPQFGQGKAVVGKVFWDFDGNGEQDLPS